MSFRCLSFRRTRTQPPSRPSESTKSRARTWARSRRLNISPTSTWHRRDQSPSMVKHLHRIGRRFVWRFAHFDLVGSDSNGIWTNTTKLQSFEIGQKTQVWKPVEDLLIAPVQTATATIKTRVDTLFDLSSASADVNCTSARLSHVGFDKVRIVLRV